MKLTTHVQLVVRLGMRVAILLPCYVPLWCAQQVYLYYVNELTTSDMGQCELLELVMNYVLPTAENTLMVRGLHSSWLLHSE
jgi:hypothetical protein